MSLPKVRLYLEAVGEQPTVLVDDREIAGVRSAQITVTADGVPQVALVLAAGQVDLDLPAGVTVVTAGPNASVFAVQLDPRRLERDALEELDDSTQGEAFAAAVRAQAADFDDR